MEAMERSFWVNILRATETTPSGITSIRGASNYEHNVLAAGFDEKRKRLVWISDEADAKSAAMAQVDVQARYRDIQVIVVRPVAANLPLAARIVAEVLGTTKLGINEARKLKGEKEGEVSASFQEALLRASNSAFIGFNRYPVANTTQIIQLIRQLSLIVWNLFPTDEDPETHGNVDICKLANFDPLQFDRDLGVCGLPLYALDSAVVESLKGTISIERMREFLMQENILQYFFPPLDQLALALVDRGITEQRELTKTLDAAPDLGHPFGPVELGSAVASMEALFQRLEAQKLVAEGEFGFELTKAGQSIRSSIKFKPREGFVSKLLARLSISLNLRDLWQPFGKP